MRVLADAWPDYALKPGTLDAYWLALNELHHSTFRVAVAECLKTCTFFPKPVEIREKACSALTASGLLPSPAEHAWSELLVASRQRWHPDIGWMTADGWPTSQTALSPLTEQAVNAIGGMARLASVTDRELGFLRAEFMAVYGSARAGELTQAGPAMRQSLPAATPDSPRLKQAKEHAA